MSDRKYHDVVLPEVKKPAGYGTLIEVLNLSGTKRELWFQHNQDPGIVRCVEIDLSNGTCGRPNTIKTWAERRR